MKPDIHPVCHPVVFIDDEFEVISKSTMSSGETREIDGVDHYIIKVDISAFSHPFYTGKEKVMDTEGRVERFKKRYGKKKAAADAGEAPAEEAAPAAEAAPADAE